MINHRRWERVAVKLDVVIFDGIGEKVGDATTTDASEAGLGLNSPVALQSGLTYGFLIASVSKTPFQGVVRWSTPNARGSRHALGVQLTGETREQSDAMRAAVTRWRAAVAKGLTPS
ncbi:MAG TPA: PilZ domain-containing protein [Candidatus Eremiobacteraceae bacterium]|nr:PilZ domain-containing protein [Candidatus Eremiobacteraceae bacterium]